MATIGGARALGMENEIGSLETGKKADVILVDLTATHMRPINNIVNNLVYCASASSDVETVIVDGQVLVHERKLLRFDEEEIVSEAEEYAIKTVCRRWVGSITLLFFVVMRALGQNQRR